MNGAHILIADDESDISLILKLLLEDAGYRTVRVRDGVEALEKLAADRFELLLLDIRMPRMDGLQVLERTRSDFPELAVVMMTAHGSEDVAVEAMKRGAVDYVAKPFSPADLLKRVERAIQFNRTRLENLRLQKELAAEQEKTSAILQGMAELLVAVDSDGKVIMVNQKAEELLGVARADLLAKPVGEVLPSDLPPDRLPSSLVLQSGAPCLDVAFTLLLPDRRVPVLASATPLFGPAGELVGAVEILRDISTLKALEREREDFVSMLSHDLKSPITSIVGSLDLVREGRLGAINEEQREFLASAVESCDEMVEMINTLLDIHKFEAGRMKVALREEDPAPLLQRVVAQYRPVAARGGLALQVEVPEELPRFPLERNMFPRLLGNLLSNAVKFTPEGGSVTLAATLLPGERARQERIPARLYPAPSIGEANRYLKITVRDSGVGIPADALYTIFDRFVQARNRQAGITKGTGLGLAFCRKVMDAHGGYIWAESEEGRGSAFRLLFPLPPAAETTQEEKP